MDMSLARSSGVPWSVLQLLGRAEFGIADQQRLIASRGLFDAARAARLPASCGCSAVARRSQTGREGERFALPLWFSQFSYRILTEPEGKTDEFPGDCRAERAVWLGGPVSLR